MNELSVVIVTYNTRKLTLGCLKSIFTKKWKTSFTVWVVDNASTDGTYNAIKENFPKVKLIESKDNLGFAGGNNLALKKVYQASEYILLLNSDTLVKPRSLDNLLSFCQKSKFEVASCRLVSPDGSFQPNAGELPYFSPVFFWMSGLDDILRKVITLNSYQQRAQRYYRNGRQVGWVSGSVMLIKNTLFNKIGFLDDKIFMYGEDVDFCWRAKKAGYRVGWTDRAEIIHIGGASSKEPRYNQLLGEFRGLIYLYKKHFGAIPSLMLRMMIYLFVFLRVIAFGAIGNLSYARTYAKILSKI